MRIRKLFVFTLFLPLLGSSSAAYSQEAEVLIKRVREKLNKVVDYQAEGLLVADIPFMKLPDSKVTVFYKNPDKFRIRKQEGISVVPKGGVSINLNSLFAGDNYTVVNAGTGSFRGNTVRIIKLLPLNETSDIVLSTLQVDEQNALILKSSTTTRDNGSFEMEFTYGRYANVGLPDKVIFLFNLKDYKLPKGVTFEYDPGTVEKKTAETKSKQGKVELRYSSYSINKGISNDVFKQG